MSGVAEVRVGAARVIHVVDSSADEQSSHFRVIQYILHTHTHTHSSYTSPAIHTHSSYTSPATHTHTHPYPLQDQAVLK